MSDIQERRALAAQILSGLLANPFVASQINQQSGAKISDDDLVGYSLHLADKLTKVSRDTIMP